jgi:hypothetical protein
MLTMIQKKKIAVWFREVIMEGDIYKQDITLYSSFDKALEAHKEFVAEEKKWYTEKYGEEGFKEDSNQRYNAAYAELYVEGEYCLNRVASSVEMVEIND